MPRALMLCALLLCAASAGGPAPAVADQPPPLSRTLVLQYAATPGHPAKRAALTRRVKRLGLDVRRFQRLPFLVVFGDRHRLARAARLPGVRHAHRPTRTIKPQLKASVPLVHGGLPSPPAWTQGFDGRGVTIAVIDSGADGLHPDLQGQVVRNVLFAYDGRVAGEGGPTSSPLALPPIECPGPCNTDLQGHGTHVAGTIAGTGAASSGSHKGVAPGASLVTLSVSRQGFGLEWFALATFDYLLAHPELEVKAVNNSWGVAERFDPDHPIQQAMKMVHAAGTAIVFAAGNDGPGDSYSRGPRGAADCHSSNGYCNINAESVGPWAISVAAGAPVRSQVFADQRLADFSSRGDPRPRRVKNVDVRYEPTVTAPGDWIMAPRATLAEGYASACSFAGTSRCTTGDPVSAPFYKLASGTSMAAPHVTGAIAVLQSAAKAKLGRWLTPDEVKRLLREGAAPMGGVDAYWSDCGEPTGLSSGPCGEVGDQHTGKPYASWQVGAGYLSIPGSLRALDALAAPPVVAPAPIAVPAPAGPAKKPAAKKRKPTKLKTCTAKRRRNCVEPRCTKSRRKRCSKPGRRCTRNAKGKRRCVVVRRRG